MVEFFEDYFEHHPEQQIRRAVDEASGQTYFVTGDALVDKWEREIALGSEPDYDEALSPAQRAREMAPCTMEDSDGFEEHFDVETR